MKKFSDWIVDEKYLQLDLSTISSLAVDRFRGMGICKE
jgi:hypothetical protein